MEMGKKEGLDDTLISRVMGRSLHLPVKVKAVARALREDIGERFGKEG